MESDSDDEIIIKKVKAPLGVSSSPRVRTKKKIIYVESDESEDEEIIEKPKRKEKPKDVVVEEKPMIVRQLKPLIRYF